MAETNPTNPTTSNQEKPPLQAPTPTPETAKKKEKPSDKRDYLVLYEGTITHDNIEYRQGSSISLTEKEANSLIIRGAIKAV